MRICGKCPLNMTQCLEIGLCDDASKQLDDELIIEHSTVGDEIDCHFHQDIPDYFTQQHMIDLYHIWHLKTYNCPSPVGVIPLWEYMLNEPMNTLVCGYDINDQAPLYIYRYFVEFLAYAEEVIDSDPNTGTEAQA